ncbi:MAG: glycosyltransferase family 2 protein, partial [Bacteroidales bacterium]
MLSILIPVYNQDVRALVGSLDRQARALGVSYEILCMDDGSEKFKSENRQLNALENCVVSELGQNVGRAKIRNALIGAAKYAYVLFLDCDMRMVHDDFVAKYWALRQKDVVCGGIAYRKQDCNRETKLHYYYGLRREVYSASGGKNPSFLTGNFFTNKEVLASVGFNRKLSGYGHEDTLFGLNLEQQGYKITYTDNPAYHTGVNTSEVFLRNTRSAIENLFQEDKTLEKELQACVRLARFALRYPVLTRVLGRGYGMNRRWIEKLLPVIPSVYLLD